MIELQTAPVATVPADLPSGRVSLPYVEQGDPAGVPVLFLHGITDSLHSFDLLMPHLPEAFHAFALTQRGHGDAERPAAGYAPGDFAADVAAFMDQQGIEQAVIVGHSLGTGVAQHFALDYPNRVLGVVLIGSLYSWAGNPALVEFVELAATLRDPIDPAFVREFQESTLSQPVPAEFIDTIVLESLKVPARVWRAVTTGFIAADFPEEIGQIAAPTLILWGEEDAYMPRVDQQALAAAIPDARLIVYPGLGHAPHWEDPARVAADLEAFVGRFCIPARAAGR